MLSRGSDVEIEPYYCLPVSVQNPLAHANAVAKTAVPWSQPTSPTPPSRFSNGPLSPTHAYRLTYPKKNDDGMFEHFQIDLLLAILIRTHTMLMFHIEYF